MPSTAIAANTDSSSIERDQETIDDNTPKGDRRAPQPSGGAPVGDRRSRRLLAGCYETAPIAAEIDPTYPIDYRDRHPITLKEGEHSVQIFVGRNRGGLTPSQRADVAAFAQLWRREATSGIIVNVPHGGPTDRAAAELDARNQFDPCGFRCAAPRDLCAPLSSLRAIRSPASRSTIRSSVAHAGPCGLWPNDLGPAGRIAYNENLPYWNFGCATQRNLAAMVDNPADLVQPRGETPALQPGAARSPSTNTARARAPPSNITASMSKGKIGDVGK